MIGIFHSSAEQYGSDRSLISIVSACAERGVSTRIVIPLAGPLQFGLEREGVLVEVSRSSPVLRRSALSLPGLFRLARCAAAFMFCRRRYRDFSVVFGNTSVCLAPYLLRIFRAKSKKPKLLICVREYFGGTLERQVFEFLLRRADQVICVSESVVQQFSSVKLRRSALVVYSGADVSKYKSTVAVLESDEPLRIAIVGRLTEWKGQSLVLDALSIVQREGHDVLLRIVGGEVSGTGYSAWLRERCSALGLDDNVEFFDETSDVSSHYMWSHATVCASVRPEPFGKVVIESMACGRPVLVSDMGGPSETVIHGHNGLHFRAGSSTSLAATIRQLLENRHEIEDMSTRCPEQASRFDEKRSGEAISLLLSKLASRTGPAL